MEVDSKLYPEPTTTLLVKWKKQCIFVAWHITNNYYSASNTEEYSQHLIVSLHIQMVST